MNQLLKLISQKKLILNNYRKNIQTGTPIVTFTVAVDTFRQKDAEGKWLPSYFSVVTFGQTAERVSEWARKGSLVAVDGRLNQRSYKREKDDVNISIVEIIADSVQRLEPKQASGELLSDEAETKESVIDDIDQTEPESNNNENIDLADDDLPF